MTKIIVMISTVMRNIVTFARAFADPTRWRVVRLVMDQALCVCELADILEMPQSSVSSHVQIIRKAGLLESEKCGKWTYFRIHPDYLLPIQALAEFFSSSDDPALEADAFRSRQRLAVRESSCCPGPKLLSARTSKPAKT